jgi:hypothetical protein
MRFAPLTVSDPQQLAMSSRASAGCWFIDLVGIFWSSQSSKYLITDQLAPQTAFAAGSINTGPPALSKSSLLIVRW